MKTSQVDILIVPGWQDSGADHWQSRWERNLKTARRVIQDDWNNPEVEAWGDRIAKFAGGATQPVVVVAHSLGVPAVVFAADKLKAKGVIGAFLVAPADVEFARFWPDTGGERWPPLGGMVAFNACRATSSLFPHNSSSPTTTCIALSLARKCWPRHGVRN